MNDIDIRDILESIIGNKKRYYTVNVNEFKVLYEKITKRNIDNFVFLFQIENQINARFYSAPNTQILIKDDYFIKKADIISFIDIKRAYIDLVSEKITIFSFFKNELFDRYNQIWILIVLLLYFPSQLYLYDVEIIKTIMESMLIFISIFFSVFLSFITMYGIESAKKSTKTSMYYEYMANSYYILTIVMMGFILTIFSLSITKYNFIASVVASSLSIIFIIIFIRSIINYYFKYAKLVNYKEMIDREFENKYQEFTERFKV